MWFSLRRRSKGNRDADKALESAKKAQIRIEASGDEVTGLSNAFKEIREKNHFIEQLQDIMDRRGGKPNEG